MSEKTYAIFFLMKHRTIHYETVKGVKEYRYFNVCLYFVLVIQDLLGEISIFTI